MPTQEQLDARLSPTAATLNLPAGGEIFRLSSNIDPTGSNGIYYRDPSGKLLNLDWATLAAMKYGPNATQLGGALNFQNGETIGGQTALKELFGIDFNQIAQKNYNDLPSLGSVGKLDPNTFKSLFSSYSAPTTSGNVTVNTTPNQLAPGVQSGVQPATIGVGGISYDANLMNKDYLRPGETPEQYATRTAQNSPGYQASTTGTPQVGPISSASMTGSSTNFKTPADYASLYGLTAPEQQAQRYITDIQGLNNQYAQKGAYESQVGSELGLNAAEGRVNALAKEQQAIPLQIQQNFEGRGVTKAGLQPIETGALRNNAIASLAASTQLADIRRTFEEEVKAKFGPIEAQIAAAKDNLQLIINSPEYSAADKKRAQTQLDYQNQKEAAILQQKDAATKIENLAMEASLAGAPDIALDKIRQAKDPIEAARIAAPYLAQKEASWSEPYMLGGDYVQRNNATGEIRTAVNVAAGGGGGSVQPGDDPQLYQGLTSQTATAVRSQVSAFKTEQVVQNFSTVQEGNNFAQGISNKTRNPAEHQALIYALAKALDPGSVVREGEYATAQKYAQSWVAAYGTGVEQAILGTGFLSESAIRDIKAVIASKYSASKTSYDALRNQYIRSVDSLTGRNDGSQFIKDYTAAAPPPPGSLPEASTDEEKTSALDSYLDDSTPETTDSGFFSSFAKVFGL